MSTDQVEPLGMFSLNSRVRSAAPRRRAVVWVTNFFLLFHMFTSRNEKVTRLPFISRLTSNSVGKTDELSKVLV